MTDHLLINQQTEVLIHQQTQLRYLQAQLALVRMEAEAELARIEEQRDTPTFSIISPASPPLRRHSPRPLLNALLAFCAVLGILLGAEYLRRFEKLSPLGAGSTRDHASES